MIVTLTNIKDIENRRKKILKHSKNLFKRFYKDIIKDVKKIYLKHNTIINKQTFIKEYKHNLQTILKLIYRKTTNEFGYDMRRALNVILKERYFSLTKSKMIDIDNDFNDKSIFLINKKVEENSDYMMDTIYGNILFYLQKSKKEIEDKIENKKKKLNRISNRINITNNKIELQKLQNQYQSINDKINDINDNNNEYVAEELENQLQSKIVNQLSDLQSQDNINYMEETARFLETQLLSLLPTTTINNKLINFNNAFIKVWDSTLDGKTRGSHAEAHGQIQNINDNFVVRNPITQINEYGQKPKDDNFSLANKIRCRCIMIIKLKI